MTPVHLLHWAMTHRARAVDLLMRGKLREAANNDEIADDYDARRAASPTPEEQA